MRLPVHLTASRAVESLDVLVHRTRCAAVLLLQLFTTGGGCGGPSSMAANAAAPNRSFARIRAEPAKPPAHPTPRRHDVVADDGHVLAVWEKSPTNPRGSILLVHGRTWSSLPDFDLQVAGEQRSSMDGLVESGFSAYAIDLRGYGDTPRDDTGWNTPNKAASDVATVLAWIDARDGVDSPPALLGWSLGSLTVQLVAQRKPQSVSAIVLYGYPRSYDHRYEPDSQRLHDPARLPTTRKAAISDFIIPGSISTEAIEAFARSALESDPVKADWRAVEQWNELDPARVRTPVLLIHGERDPYAPVTAQAELFARLAHADRTWVIVAGGDHAAHLEDTRDRWLHAVVTFLQRPRNPNPSTDDNQQ